MGANLELLSGILMHIGGLIHRIDMLVRRQRNRTDKLGAAALSTLDDLIDRLVNHFVIVRLQADADALFGVVLGCQGACELVQRPAIGGALRRYVTSLFW